MNCKADFIEIDRVINVHDTNSYGEPQSWGLAEIRAYDKENNLLGTAISDLIDVQPGEINFTIDFQWSKYNGHHVTRLYLQDKGYVFDVDGIVLITIKTVKRA